MTAYAIRFLFASNQIFNDLSTTADDPLGLTLRKDRPRAGLERRFGRSLLHPDCLKSPTRTAYLRPEVCVAHNALPLCGQKNLYRAQRQPLCVQVWETRKNFSSRGSRQRIQLRRKSLNPVLPSTTLSKSSAVRKGQNQLFCTELIRLAIWQIPKSVYHDPGGFPNRRQFGSVSV